MTIHAVTMTLKKSTLEIWLRLWFKKKSNKKYKNDQHGFRSKNLSIQVTGRVCMYALNLNTYQLMYNIKLTHDLLES